jgi:hypothetical protein
MRGDKSAPGPSPTELNSRVPGVEVGAGEFLAFTRGGVVIAEAAEESAGFGVATAEVQKSPRNPADVALRSR